MSTLTRRHGELFMEETPLSKIAATFGTPCFAYSRKTITDNYLAYANALGDWPGMICYSVKANSNLGVLSILAQLGSGFDIVSSGELERVLKAGGDPARVVFSGIGKSPSEMARALEVGVHCFNVESDSELEALSQVASAQDKVASVSLRVNPDVDAKTHPYISTGLKENKFGVDINRAEEIYDKATTLPGIRVVGVDCHIGSQLTEVEPFLDALDRTLALVETLEKKGIAIHHLDLGGGLGVTYQDETPPPIDTYISAVKERLGDRQLELIFEPGRSIVADSGILLTRIEYLKPTDKKNFAIVDAAMNDLIRPSLYQAWQEILPVSDHNEAETLLWDVVGPICESADFLGKDRLLKIDAGGLLAIKSSGAYGFVMSSNYNTRPRAAEIVVDGDTLHQVRRRESVEELFEHESCLPK